jgi:hypothetical protein
LRLPGPALPSSPLQPGTIAATATKMNMARLVVITASSAG